MADELPASWPAMRDNRAFSPVPFDMLKDLLCSIWDALRHPGENDAARSGTLAIPSFAVVYQLLFLHNMQEHIMYRKINSSLHPSIN